MKNTKLNLREFLNANSYLINEGLNFIDKFCDRNSFIDSLRKVNFDLIVVPDHKWPVLKLGQTQSSFDNKNVQIKKSYFDENPLFTKYIDKYNWAYHEFVHALIFSGNFPKNFLNINSPFHYPMNTDEIYAFGFQIKNMKNKEEFDNLLSFYDNCWNDSFISLKNIVIV